MAKYGESSYGILQYGEEIQPDEKGVEHYKPDLMKYLPAYYEKSEISFNPS